MFTAHHTNISVSRNKCNAMSSQKRTCNLFIAMQGLHFYEIKSQME